jgi:hypothetical protein
MLNASKLPAQNVRSVHIEGRIHCFRHQNSTFRPLYVTSTGIGETKSEQIIFLPQDLIVDNLRQVITFRY